MSASKTSPFAQLLSRQVTAAQRERLMQLRDELALADTDALWALLELVEEYCAGLLKRRCQPTPPSTQSPWRLLALGMGAQVVLVAVAMYVGARAASAGSALDWARCQQASSPHGLLATILSAPAGWLTFVLVLPVLAHGVRLGWRLRAEEPLAGWIIASTSTLTATGFVGLLLWLM